MEKYLKMSDVFYAAVEPKQLSGWKHQGRYVELKIIQEAAAHAINSHDELVAMNKELLAALEGMIEVYGGTNSYDGLPKSAVEIELVGLARETIKKAKASS